MALQSPLEQLKSARIGRSALIALAAGIVVGLALGLLIGWVWWPVDWQGAAPTPRNRAPHTELSPDIKAYYMGAIADAYAANPNNTEAAQLAARAAVGSLTWRYPHQLQRSYRFLREPGQRCTTQITNLQPVGVHSGYTIAGHNCRPGACRC